MQHREVALRGLAGDVAARLVAIAVSEMVRAAMAPRPAPPPLPPPVPRRTPEEIEQARRNAPALSVGAGAELAVLPATGVVAGPSLSVAFRRFGAAESIFGRWLEGNGGLRWLELGLGAEYRFHLGRSFRLGVGAQGAFSSVHLSDATSVEGQAGQSESWSARAGGVVAFDVHLSSPFWLSFHLEPGAILRPVHYTAGSGGGTVEGAWLGLGAAIHYERVFAAEP
jgi:hypothetical protein